jgi:epoxyqueuosine reductase QueG
MPSFQDNPAEIIIREIKNFVSENKGNQNSELDGIPYFDTPLIGFADANDHHFWEFKNIIGEFHLTPVEILERSFPEHATSWDKSSVISWILPISRSIRESNRQETQYPTKAWGYTRTYGEEFNEQLRRHIVSFIQEEGFLVVAPVISPLFDWCQSDKVGFASNWSERHVAFVAGLGTFSLSRGLITSKGVAMRCGSVVTNLKLNPTSRSYSDFQEYCLFYNSGRCGRCIERCPGGAISKEGHDKDLCFIYCQEIWQKSDGEILGCGLCQTGVPCEAVIPDNIKERKIPDE